MKYAFMTFSTIPLTLEETLAVANQYGYDGLEPRIDAKHAHGVEVDTSPAERQAIRDAFANAGVANACVATSCKFAVVEKAAETVEEAHTRIDLAADTGAPCLRVFGGRFGDEVTREQAADTMVASLSAVADHAGERGVTICLETHDDWRDPRDVAGVLSRVNHSAIAANWDVIHPIRSKLATLDESFEALKPYIRHLHIHDGDTITGDLKMMAMGTGGVDHKRIIELLRMIDYDGYLSGEWIKWEPYEVHLPREIATLRRYEAELG